MSRGRVFLMPPTYAAPRHHHRASVVTRSGAASTLAPASTNSFAQAVELAFGLGVCEPAEQMAVEGPRSLLMREVPGAFDELPAVRSFDVASGTLGAARQYVRVQRAVQVQRGHLDGSMHPVAITQAVRPGL